MDTILLDLNVLKPIKEWPPIIEEGVHDGIGAECEYKQVGDSIYYREVQRWVLIVSSKIEFVVLYNNTGNVVQSAKPIIQLVGGPRHLCSREWVWGSRKTIWSLGGKVNHWKRHCECTQCTYKDKTPYLPRYHQWTPSPTNLSPIKCQCTHSQAAVYFKELVHGYIVRYN